MKSSILKFRPFPLLPKIYAPLALCLVAFGSKAEACSMCMGASDAPIAPAVNASIFLLLGIIACLGGGFFSFLLYLAKRDGVSLSVDQELSQSIATATTAS